MFRKFGDKQKIELLNNRETETINKFKEKTGKAIEDLSDEERKEFRKILGCCGNDKCSCKS